MSLHSDRLYELLPAIYRIRDAEQGWPLRALLGVIAEQVDLVEEDISQLYENWFIETCQDWIVPYIGELIGYQLIHEAGEPGDGNTTEALARNKILIPRRDVADTIHNRRHKGTLALLEELAADVAGWPSRAVEYFKLLAWTQKIDHFHSDRAQTLNVRDGDALDLLNTPFDRFAHTVDIRRINSRGTPGYYNLPSVGLFVWRLKPYSVGKAGAGMVSETPAFCVEDVGLQNYTFSLLGNDVQLYHHPQPEEEPTHVADELNLPVPIRRRAFEKRITDYYGEGKSLAIWVSNWASYGVKQLVPPEAIIPADLTNWQYLPPRNHIAVDPVLGRITFHPSQLPKRTVRVFYHYAFSADMGGGEYDRTLSQPGGYRLYQVGEAETFRRINEALEQWRKDQPPNAVIEITDSSVYVEQLVIELQEDQTLQIRAANRKRPAIRLLDWQTDLPDALGIYLSHGSRLTLDGLLITGRSVAIHQTEGAQDPKAICPPVFTIRHCTLVPGWGLYGDCEPRQPAKPSLELFNVHARINIEHSIVGSIQINEDQVTSDPIPVHVTDSILDATSEEREALAAPGRLVAHALLTIKRTTVLGIIEVHAIELAENCIFIGCINVARRQGGCMRFCYVPPGCRTPRRYHCQPDLVEKAVLDLFARHEITETEKERCLEMERLRVRPLFNSVRYGKAAYCQLAESCAVEIKRGADDESELGVFHDLYNPQREANLRARLNEYTPARSNAGIIYAS